MKVVIMFPGNLTAPFATRIGRWALPACVALLFMGMFGSASLHAADSITSYEQALDIVVNRTLDYLASEKKKSISISRFDGPRGTSFGTGMKLDLIRRLDKRLKEPGVDVQIDNVDPEITLRGRFQFDPQDRVVTVVAEVFDRNNRELAEFRKFFTDTRISAVEDLAALLGTTTDVTAEIKDTKDPKERREAVATQITKDSLVPGLVIDGSKALAKKGGLFQVEIVNLDSAGRTTTETLPITNRKGFGFVNLQREQQFGVRFYNNADFDVGVELRMDGINSLALCKDDDYRGLGRWLIRAKSSGTVRGWLIDPSPEKPELFTFKATDFAQSVIKEISAQDLSQLGTISASFFPAWLGDAQPELETQGPLERTKDAGGIGKGVRIFDPVTRSERFHGRTLLSSITLRYIRPESSDVSLTGTASR